MTGTYVQNKASRTERGESSHSLPPKKHFEGLPRASEGTDRAQTSTNLAGRASRVDFSAYGHKCSYDDMFGKVRKFHNIAMRSTYLVYSTVCPAPYMYGPSVLQTFERRNRRAGGRNHNSRRSLGLSLSSGQRRAVCLCASALHAQLSTSSTRYSRMTPHFRTSCPLRA